MTGVLDPGFGISLQEAGECMYEIPSSYQALRIVFYWVALLEDGIVVALDTELSSCQNRTTDLQQHAHTCQYFAPQRHNWTSARLL